MVTSIGRPTATTAELKPERSKVTDHSNENNRLFVLTEDFDDVTQVRDHLTGRSISSPEDKVVQISNENEEDYKEISKSLTDPGSNNIGFIVRNGSKNIVDKLTKLFKYIYEKRGTSNNPKIYIAADGSFNNLTSVASSLEQNSFAIQNFNPHLLDFLVEFFHKQLKDWKDFREWITEKEAQTTTPSKGFRTTKVKSKSETNTGGGFDISPIKTIIHQPEKPKTGRIVHDANLKPQIEKFLPFVNKIFDLSLH